MKGELERLLSHHAFVEILEEKAHNLFLHSTPNNGRP